jgi:pimeloyl-ACP methyl ester carboxylesterase
MKVVDRGGGTPVVVIPGVQGRWEWMAPAIDALAARCRVVTFSLADEPACGGRFDEAEGFSCYVEQVRDALDAAGLQQAAVCGVSYGGLIAAAFAAKHPDRVSALILVSAIPPSWHPDARVRFYLRAPRLLTPLFMLASLRLYREIAAARGGLAAGAAAAARHGWRVLTHMFSPPRMARRVRLLEGAALPRDPASIHVPTLVVTGEPSLDRVVPVGATHEYLRLCPHATVATLERTGHLGLITRPDEFARLVVPFAERAARGDDTRRRVG